MDIGNIIDAAFSNALGPQAIVFALAAIGLNIHFGYTGLLNFGQAGFMAVGAYGLAVAMVRLDLPLPAGIALGMVAALLLALVLGVPTLRLRADYLAIVTIAAAEILRLVFGAVETKKVFGGSNGLNGFTQTWNDLNPYTKGIDLGFASWGRNDLWAMTVGWVVVALCCLLTWALMRSPWGRVLRSIREDEDAVRSLGKNVFLYKMQALMLGGVIGGLGGIFFALKQGSVVPSDYSTNLTFFAYTALLIGGAARVLGPVIGSMIFWFLISGLGEFFSQATRGIDPLIPASVMTDTQASLIRYILMGLGLMLLMIYRPQGIFGDRREIALDAR
ncbi:branched-chain amino acid ABC transporter permease [Aeromicrobium duanguangcaii]|uniref:Branched-chain amino acid ABC transporter permease n=1 Tax=Aeromicrobium duanguangcaii TaxID=2968086 RepID=A0ABY5KGB8_9ACTN|nr:branched-chain amino acid ABC transporter permease [Aeromicrobium duanguangcaii]MCL3837389.1 branched-chain amino acid ABC transporter permease [Aeromicrobium duanguangcaii]UUI67418.1 branched-chain amino acid ABC transporter permease [Aeromicrobium duanguangcaii]